MSWKLQNLAGRSGRRPADALRRATDWAKPGLLILAGLIVANAAWAQTNFSSAEWLGQTEWGTVTNDNTGVTKDTGDPNIAGFSPVKPLWYTWTAPKDGVVELDTVGSIAWVTNYIVIGFDTNFVPLYLTNIYPVNLDTVLGVYQGNSSDPKQLNQIAANDDLYPVNSSLALGNGGAGVLTSPLTDEAANYGYIPSYYGPSHLRFTAKAGQTYYFAVDTKNQKGVLSLNWAYKPSGVFRFASEDQDWVTGLPLYQTAETESRTPAGLNSDYRSVVTTYYTYNAPGCLVTVTRGAGARGRAIVDYQTINGTNLPAVSPSDQPGIAGVDYVPVSGQLVFDDFEMSKTILIPIVPHEIKYGLGTMGDQSNRVFGIQLLTPYPYLVTNVDDLGNTNVVTNTIVTPFLDPLEDANAVSPPRVDPVFGTAIVKILNTDADPWGPDLDTNGVPLPYPTNATYNFEKANFRVPADVTDPAISPYSYANVTLYVMRGGTNTSAEVINYRVDAYLNDPVGDAKEYNNFFPLQPGSDYAVPLPANQDLAFMRNYNTASYDRVTTNYDFDVVDGTVSFPATGNGRYYQPIHIKIPISKATKFNKDFRVVLYREVKVGGATVAEIPGMNAETTVTILFNDENPPAGSVDEFYNADFDNASEVATLPSRVPPSVGSTPGVGSPMFPGQVYSIALWTNDEAVIGGDFSTYNGASINGLALIQTNGQLDTSFYPSSGVGGNLPHIGNSPPDPHVNAAAISGNQIYIGGDFTAFNNTLVGGVARVNADGSLDTAFNNGGSGADGVVRALAVQADGKVLIGGDFSHVNGLARNYIARLNANGTVDTTFDPTNTLGGPVYAIAEPLSGLTITNAGSGGSNEVDQAINLGPATSGTLMVSYDMLQQPDDMRVFYGDTNVAAGSGVLIYDTGLVSFTGSFVLPFGPTNGLTTNVITIVMNQGGGQVGTLWSYSASVNFGISRIMVGGNFNVAGQAYSDIARLNTNGTLDVSFNPGTGPNGIVHALGWQLNNQIVAGGEFTLVSGLSCNHIARFNADGSLDTTNFLAGSGADDVVYNVTLDQLGGTIYVGGAFESFNGTHRRGFARLYSNGTVDTTFLDTAYNQFAGLKKIYAVDSPAVFASALQGNGGVLIGGSFLQVGGGQADPNIANTLDEDLFLPELGSFDSFADPNLWVEPKTRDGFRNRIGFARLIGGSTPGPGNIGLSQTSYSQNKSISSLTVGLVRTNGWLGPASANFIVQPGLAQAGKDYSYQAAPPMYWIAWNYLNLLSRMREDGLWGVSGNSLLIDALGASLSSADRTVNNLAAVNVGIIANQSNPGNLNAQFQLANPSLDTFYLGGEEIPLGAALGVSSAPMSFIDDTTYPGQFGFISPSYIATNLSPAITLVRSNGAFGIVSMRGWATNGTAIAGTDYRGITNLSIVFNTSVTSTNFTVTVLNDGFVTNVEKTVNMRLGNLGTTPGATFGISNAVLRIINPGFQGYVTLAATNFTGTTGSGVLNFVVNRVAGSLGAFSIAYATTNGTAINGVDYAGSTNTLSWNSGDVTPRTVSIPLLPNQTVGGTPKQFSVRLLTNGVSTPALVGVVSNATLTISNNNSYGALQFSSPVYLVSEAADNYALLTVIRTGGLVGTDYVGFATSDGANAASGVNYYPTNGVLTFAPNQIVQTFRVYVKDDGATDPAPTNYYFNVTLSNAVNGTLGSPTNAQVQIFDATNTWPPGLPDTAFTPDGMNGDVFALSLNSSGQILAGGNFTGVGTAARGRVARLNTDGSLDAGFLNGLDGANAAVNAVVCQTTLSDADRVLIGGAFTTVNNSPVYTRYFVARLMTDGSVDTSFNPGAGADNVVNAIAEAFFANGANLVRKIYVGGAFTSFNGNTSPGVVRLNNDGTMDSSFNAGLGSDGPVYAIAVYPANSVYAGKLLIGGAFAHFNGVSITNLARLNADGSLDSAFNANLGAGPNDSVRALAIQADASVLVGGSFTNFNGTSLNCIARLNSGGTLDNSFTTNLVGGANGTVDAIALQTDSRIIVGGQFTRFNGVTRNHITRLLPTGATDPAINFGLGANGGVDALLVQPADGRIVIGGAFTLFNNLTASHIARIYGGSTTGSGAFEFSTGNYRADENESAAAVTILRTGGTAGTNSDGSGDVFVHFATSDGTAVNGTNYSAVSTNVDFPAGEVSKTVLIPVLDDFAVTPDLTVNLALSSPTPPAVIANPGQPTAVLTIVNDDSTVSFQTAFPTVYENVAGGLADINVIRQGGTNSACTVDFYTTTNGSTGIPGVDYYPTNETITFNPGDTNLTAQILIISNSILAKTVGLLLTNPVNTILYAPSNATLTVENNVNPPGEVYFAATNFPVNEGDGSAMITVLRTNGSFGKISVNYATVQGTARPNVDYQSAGGALTFDDGDAAPKQFSVQLLNNNVPHAPVSFSVVLSLSPTSTNGTLIAPTNSTVTIFDNVNTGFAFAVATNPPAIETAGFVSVTVLRLGATNNPVQVNYATANGTPPGAAIAGVNYQPESGTLPFAAGESSRSVQIPLIDDPQVTGTLYFTIALSNPTAGTQIVAPGTNTVVVLDADAGLSFITNAISVLKNTNSGSAVITVVCSNPSVEPVIVDSNSVPLSVQYSTTNGTASAGIDYTAVSGTLVFTNGIGTNTFTVPIINNGLVTGNRAFAVSLSNPTPPGQLVSPSDQVVTIIDSNSGLSFSNAAFTVLKSGVAANINVFRTGYTDSVVSVNFLATNGTALAGIQFVATNGTLLFTNGVTNLAFSVPIINTTVVQPDETVLLELLNPTNGFLVAPSAATLTIHDTSGSYVVPAGSALVSETGAGAPNGIIDSNETVTVLFAFRDAGGTNVNDLKATLLAINGITSPSPVTQDYGPLTYGRHSVSRPFTFTAHGTNSQQIAATFQLKDGVNNIGTNVFGYTLGAWTTVVSNSAMIIINDHAIASPYPSAINISGLGGSLVKAAITLTNLWHPSPKDIDALLVSPGGLNTLFMAHAGGQNGLQNVTITFDDATNYTFLPQNAPITTLPNAVITNRPTAYPPVPPFP